MLQAAVKGAHSLAHIAKGSELNQLGCLRGSLEPELLARPEPAAAVCAPELVEVLDRLCQVGHNSCVRGPWVSETHCRRG